MEIRVNGDDKKELVHTVESVLVLQGVENILIACVDDRIMVANRIMDAETFINAMLWTIFDSCKKKRSGVLTMLDAMREVAESLPEEEKKEC